MLCFFYAVTGFGIKFMAKHCHGLEKFRGIVYDTLHLHIKERTWQIKNLRAWSGATA